MTREEILETMPDVDFVFADGLDEAIIGITNKFIVVYSVSKIYEILRIDMSEIEAIEYFSFNIEGAYMGDLTPIYVYNNIFY